MSDRADNPREDRIISLVKGDRTFFVRFEPGRESEILDALIALVHRRDLDFDWYDAAVLSHQLGQHLAAELNAFVPGK